MEAPFIWHRPTLLACPCCPLCAPLPPSLQCTHITPSRGFAMELSTSFVIAVGSAFGEGNCCAVPTRYGDSMSLQLRRCSKLGGWYLQQLNAYGIAATRCRLKHVPATAGGNSILSPRLTGADSVSRHLPTRWQHGLASKHDAEPYSPCCCCLLQGCRCPPRTPSLAPLLVVALLRAAPRPSTGGCTPRCSQAGE
jgi:hypothetical protein